MVVLGGWAFSYERGTPVVKADCDETECEVSPCARGTAARDTTGYERRESFWCRHAAPWERRKFCGGLDFLKSFN